MTKTGFILFAGILTGLLLNQYEAVAYWVYVIIEDTTGIKIFQATATAFLEEHGGYSGEASFRIGSAFVLLGISSVLIIIVSIEKLIFFFQRQRMNDIETY